MKQFKVTDLHGDGEAFDLINIEDPKDMYMGAPFEFEDGEIVRYEDLTFTDNMYLDEDGNYVRGTFAYKKQ